MQSRAELTPQVSIICTAYNHEKYIGDAIEGFLMQVTDFPLEIIIHDDASTDNTAGIINKYYKENPDIIRPIIQTDNQYSKGVSIHYSIIYPLIRGKYVAICEGDDYWTDPEKLQKQYRFLQEHPEIDICTHKAADTRDGEFIRFIGPDRGDCIIPPEEVIYGGGGFVATNSIMIRTDALTKRTPFRDILSLDYTVQIQGSLKGGMGYLGDCMSVYRRGVTGSWTDRMSADKPCLIEHHDKIERMLLELNSFTNGKYEETIKRTITKYRYEKFMFTGEYRLVLAKEYRELLNEEPLKKRIKVLLKGLLNG